MAAGKPQYKALQQKNAVVPSFADPDAQNDAIDGGSGAPALKRTRPDHDAQDDAIDGGSGVPA